MRGWTLIDETLDVMSVLWRRGPATPGEIERALDEEAAVPAVRALLHGLEEEGYVRPEREEGGRRYRATCTRSEFGRSAARRVLEQFFDGSVSAFLQAVADCAGRPPHPPEAPGGRGPDRPLGAS